MNIRSLFKKSFLFLCIRMAGICISFVMFAALARLLGEHSFGLFSMAFSAVLLLVPLLSFARREVVQRFIPRYEALNQPEVVETLIREGWSMIVRMSLLAIGGSVIAALILRAARPEMSTETILLLPFAALLLMATQVAEYQMHIMRGKGQIFWAMVPRDIFWRVLVIAALMAATAAGWPVDAPLAILIMCVLLMAIAVLQAAIDPEIRPQFRMLFKRYKLPEDAARAARLIWLPNVLTTGYPNLVHLAVGFMIAPAESGLLFVAQRVANLLTIPLLSARSISINAISSMHAKGNLTEIQHKLSRLTLLIGLSSAAVFVFITVFAGWILSFFSPAYADSGHVLIIMSLGPLLTTLAGPLGVMLQAAGYEHYYSRAIILSNIVAFLLLIAGILLFGVIGAAWAVTLQVIFWNATLWVLIRRIKAPDVSVIGMIFPVTSFADMDSKDTDA